MCMHECDHNYAHHGSNSLVSLTPTRRPFIGHVQNKGMAALKRPEVKLCRRGNMMHRAHHARLLGPS